jgi:hypothetical protein
VRDRLGDVIGALRRRQLFIECGRAVTSALGSALGEAASENNFNPEIVLQFYSLAPEDLALRQFKRTGVAADSCVRNQFGRPDALRRPNPKWFGEAKSVARPQ